MTVPIQAPEIPEALRRALRIANVGGFRMELDSLIIPTINIGDVDAVSGTGFRSYIGRMNVGAVAAQYPYAAMWWNTTGGGDTGDVQRMELHAMSVWSATAQSIFAGWGNITIPAFNGVVIPKLQRASAGTSRGFGAMGGGNTAVAWTDAQYGYQVPVLASAAQRIVFEDPFILPQVTSGASQGFFIHGSVVNTDLVVTCEWREYTRG